LPTAPPSDLPILDRLEMFGIRMGLSSIRSLLGSFGSPERRVPSVLVAGTNGKGSTSSLLAAMASAAGYRTGLYTSPHLEGVEERIRLDGEVIPRERLTEILVRVVAMAERKLGFPPTYFEALTAAAFLYFAEEEADLAVLEVGMGGRLDATNAADPVLSVITSVGLDHRQYLGDTLWAVAREKGGILRPHRPALAWPGGDEATRSLVELAARVKARLRLAETEARIAPLPVQDPLAGQELSITTVAGTYELSIRLPGTHQEANAALAVLGAETLSQLGWGGLDRPAVEAGARACRWPGRLERVRLPASGASGREVSVVLDAAHNPAAAEALAAFLRRLGRPFHLLFGTFVDKEAAGMLPPLAADAAGVTLTRAPSSRGRAAEELRGLVPPGIDPLREEDPIRALEGALAAVSSVPEPPLLVITGSLYLVGELRRELTRRFAVPEPALGPLYRFR